MIEGKEVKNRDPGYTYHTVKQQGKTQGLAAFIGTCAPE